jgi:hypothetical protein
MVKKTIISLFLLTYSLGANAQTKFIYGEAGLNNCSVLSFESLRRKSIPDNISSITFRPKISYEIGLGMQSVKINLGLVFKSMTFQDIDRYYISSIRGRSFYYKEQSGKGTFYSLAPRLGYNFYNKNKSNIQTFIELGIPIGAKIAPSEMVYSNDSVSYNNTLLVYAFDFRTGIVFNRKLSRNLDLSCAAYYLYMGHDNYEDFTGFQPERLWGIGGGFLGMNMAVRYKFHYKKD